MSTSRAHSGDNVVVSINHIKAEKRQKFEHLMEEVVWPKSRQCNPNVEQSIRALYPVAENEDGTFTYVYLIDPVMEETDYRLPSILQKTCRGEVEVDQYLADWDDCYASPQVSYRLTQSNL